MAAGPSAAESAMRKLDEFYAGLPPEEQDVIAGLVRQAAQQAVEGNEVEGYIILHFSEGLTLNNSPSLFRALGSDVGAFTTYDNVPGPRTGPEPHI